MIRCVSFDFDGTLVQSNEIKRNAYFVAAARYQCPSEVVSAMVAETEGDRHGVLAALANELGARDLLPAGTSSNEAAQQMVDDYGRHCESEIMRCPDMPGARAALERLSALAIPLYVNSATPDLPLRQIIELRGLDGNFAGVLGGSRSKAENLRTIMRQQHCTGEELVHIGDDEDDRDAAAAAGCRFVGFVAPDAIGRQFRQAPTMVVSDLSMFPTAVGLGTARSATDCRRATT